VIADQPFEPVPNEGVEEYGPGESAASWRPGDLVLTHGSAFTSKLIRFGQRLRIHGDDRKYTHWNHVAIVVGADGSLVEALGRGVTRTNVSKYEPREYHVLKVEASAKDREQAVLFCLYASGEVYANGEPRGERIRYGWITIASITFALVTGARFSFQLDGTEICSGLAARAMERTGAIFNRSPSHLMPADIAKYFDPAQQPER
jgi:hypothetical protein